MLILPSASGAGVQGVQAAVRGRRGRCWCPYGHISQGLGKVNFYKGRGCATCNFTGMKAAVAIYEVMPISQGSSATS